MILDPNARMTKAGQLAEATALRQEVRQKRKSPAALKGFDRASMGTAFHGGQLIDMVAPRSGSTYWTISGRNAQQYTVDALSEGLAQPNIAEAMRGLVERLGKRASSRGLRGMVGDLAQNAKASLPGGACFEEHQYENEAGSRRYKLFVPGRYCAEPLPLIVMLHGCKQSPDDFAAGTRLNELAEEQGLLVAYPGNRPRQTPQNAGTGSAPTTSEGTEANLL